MANKLKLAHERRKVALRGAVLSARAKIANEQDRLTRLRAELASMKQSKRKQEL